MAENNIQPVVQKHAKGINKDFNSVDQPKGTYRFAMNAVSETREGDILTIATEESNKEYFDFTIHTPTGVEVSIITIGSIYVDDNEHVVFGTTFKEDYSVIALLDDNAGVTILIEDETNSCLNFRHANQINGTYRLRNGCEKTIYWVDRRNDVRTFSPSTDYHSEYWKEEWLRPLARWEEDPANNPEPVRPTGSDLNNKYDCSKFDLIKEYDDIPIFASAEVVEGGELKPGSYNFAIQYVDENENPTEWITSSMPIVIFDTKRAGNYYNVDGAEYTDEPPGSSPAFGINKTSKAIKLTITNFDPNYKFYRIAIIEYTSGTGEATRALLSYNQLTSEDEFVYNGDQKSYTLMAVEEILLDKPDIGSAIAIEQVEDRLLVANTKGKERDYCGYQTLASKIKTSYITKKVPAHDYYANGNPKDPTTMWNNLSAMAGETYALGIVYVHDDNSISPAYHIPGRPMIDKWDNFIINEDYNTEHAGSGDQPRWKVYNTAKENGVMAYHELGTSYPRRDSCSDEGHDYWGKDSEGNDLAGSAIRHHRFPTRNLIPLVEKGIEEQNYSSVVEMFIDTRDEDAPRRLYWKFKFDYCPNPYDDIWQLGRTEEGSITEVDKGWTGEQGEWSNYAGELFSLPGKIRYLELDIPSYVTVPTICNSTKRFEINGQSDASCNCISGCHRDTAVNLTVKNTSNLASDDQLILIGTKFENIELPPGVRGYYFVRGDRDDFNRQVLGKAYSGANRKRGTGMGQTTGFAGMLNSDGSGIPPRMMDPSVNLTEDFYYLMSPENMFADKDLEPSYLRHESSYVFKETFGTASNTSTPSNGRTNIAQDVAGEKSGMFDKDGFDWEGAFAGRRFKQPVSVDQTNHSVNHSLHLPPINKRTGYQYNQPNDGPPITGTLYNCVFDNGIQMVNTNHKYNWEDNPSTDVNYVALMSNRSIHPILDNIKYYKMHNNMEKEESFEVYGFDTHISQFNPSTSVYQGLNQITRVMDFVVIAVTIIASAVVSIVSFGSLSVLAAIAVAFVIAAALAKITVAAVETFGKDFAEDEGFRKLVGRGYSYSEAKDDMLYAGMEYTDGLYIESDINVALRVPVNFGSTDYIRNPNYMSAKPYLTNKWLHRDEDGLTRQDVPDGEGGTKTEWSGNGKYIYRGIPCAEIYKHNPDYSRINREKVFFPLSGTYKCCSECLEDFPNRIYYSEKSFREELSDSFGKILPLNYIDIPGEHGEITNVFTRMNALYAHTSKAIWYIAQNIQERVTNDVVSLVGTGGFFQFPPRKIQEDIVGSGGSTQRFATLKTRHGIFYVDDSEGKVYMMNFSSQTGTQIEDISQKGMSKWFRQNMPLKLFNDIYKLTGEYYPNTINPSGVNGVGYLSAMDYENNRIILTKRDYTIAPKYRDRTIVVNNKQWRDDGDLGPCVSPTGKWNAAPGELPTPKEYTGPLVLNLYDGNFYSTYCTAGREYASLVILDDTEFFQQHSWTVSYSFSTGGWTSFHSYLPRLFIYDHNRFYSSGPGLGDIRYKLWKHNEPDDYLQFYDTPFPHILEYVASSNPVATGLYNDIMLQTEAIKNDTEQRLVTWNKAIFTNTRQCSGEIDLNVLEQNLTADYMLDSINNVTSQTNIKKRNKNWYINGIRDMRTDYDQPIWLKDWQHLKGSYYIDKVINTNALNGKVWRERELFRDKYLIIRLIFDNRNDIKLLTNYTIAMEQSVTQ